VVHILLYHHDYWNSETTFMLTMAYLTAAELCVKLSVEDHVKRCLIVCIELKYQSFNSDII